MLSVRSLLFNHFKFETIFINFKISAFVLNLYNFNSYTAVDIILLVVGIPLALLWLGVGVGMVSFNYCHFLHLTVYIKRKILYSTYVFNNIGPP